MGYREDIENKFSDGILLLKEFIYSEYRLPMTIKEERNLYNVYYESVTAWENGTMTECRKNLFLSIFPEGKYCTPTELSEKLFLMQDLCEYTNGYLTLYGAVKQGRIHITDATSWRKRGYFLVKDMLISPYFKASSSASPEKIYSFLDRLIGLPPVGVVRLFIDLDSCERCERFAVGGKLSIKKFFFDVFKTHDALRILNLLYFDFYCFDLMKNNLNPEEIQKVVDCYGLKEKGYYDGMYGKGTIAHQHVKDILFKMIRGKDAYNILYVRGRLQVPYRLKLKIEEYNLK